eukprot:CAMPEP_0117653734 /NCGR_PEP_ID=MMETSP0804-20121206/3357_1 /TAXON_ID=1074897 /ORGANISM="Tetraselmis astigmatica, Strain CCMP880" /LENGTH=809 /DNA_ID=CAMNT_0005459945 /DNA_START=317 /DNA_END=2746 /DNA_ORIENTATION=-
MAQAVVLSARASYCPFTRCYVPTQSPKRQIRVSGPSWPLPLRRHGVVPFPRAKRLGRLEAAPVSAAVSAAGPPSLAAAVVVAEATGALGSSAGLLGALIALSSVGVYTALREAVERARETELRARALSRHQRFLSSASNQDNNRQEIQTEIEDDVISMRQARSPVRGPFWVTGQTNRLGSCMSGTPVSPAAPQQEMAPALSLNAILASPENVAPDETTTSPPADSVATDSVSSLQPAADSILTPVATASEPVPPAATDGVPAAAAMAFDAANSSEPDSDDVQGAPYTVDVSEMSLSNTAAADSELAVTASLPSTGGIPSPNTESVPELTGPTISLSDAEVVEVLAAVQLVDDSSAMVSPFLDASSSSSSASLDSLMTATDSTVFLPAAVSAQGGICPPDSMEEAALPPSAEQPSDLPAPPNGDSSEQRVEAATLSRADIPRPSQVKLFYSTGWATAVVHGSIRGSTWTGYNATVGSPIGWHTATIDVGDTPSPEGSPALEFVMTNKEYLDWDKPLDGGNYVIEEPGNYRLQHGVLTKMGDVVPFMVVSDLDGTMVGDDARTAAFKDYWESGPRFQGCKLVYSSGRSLASFLELQESKRGILAEPDMLILGVGTQVYNRGVSGFEQDEQWSKELDQGWDLQVVRDAAYAALATAGKEAMHFRPPEEQNDHKVTCGVRTDVLQDVISAIDAKISSQKVNVNIISSGQGDWRYLDLVAMKAGKRESLEYVARSSGFRLDRTVACGDSGNDILMLAGSSKAIVVGNAQDDLRQWVEDNPWDVSKADGPARVKVTDAFEAEGILEGLQYFGFRA